MAKRKEGGKLKRTEVIGVRLDPKLRQAADLAATKHRRTLSSFIEWAVEQAVRQVPVAGGVTAWQAVDETWDTEEADRFVARACLYPELLSFDEQKLWSAICEHYALAGVDLNRSLSRDAVEKQDVQLKARLLKHIRRNWGRFPSDRSQEALWKPEPWTD